MKNERLAHELRKRIDFKFLVLNSILFYLFKIKYMIFFIIDDNHKEKAGIPNGNHNKNVGIPTDNQQIKHGIPNDETWYTQNNIS